MRTRDDAISAADENIAGPVAVGSPLDREPGLVSSWEQGADDNETDQSSIYGGDEIGYTNYPFLQDSGYVQKLIQVRRESSFNLRHRAGAVV